VDDVPESRRRTGMGDNDSRSPKYGRVPICVFYLQWVTLSNHGMIEKMHEEGWYQVGACERYHGSVLMRKDEDGKEKERKGEIKSCL
jgi:hypothetical protein